MTFTSVSFLLTNFAILWRALSTVPAFSHLKTNSGGEDHTPHSLLVIRCKESLGKSFTKRYAVYIVHGVPCKSLCILYIVPSPGIVHCALQKSLYLVHCTFSWQANFSSWLYPALGSPFSLGTCSSSLMSWHCYRYHHFIIIEMW